MANTPGPTQPSPPRRQMERARVAGDPRTFDATAAEAAMQSRQRLTGEATGVGSIDFDESGAFDVGAGGVQLPPEDEENPRR